MDTSTLIIGILFITVLITAGAVLAVYFRIRSMQGQLAKFAFLVREDTKKFFEEAGQQAVTLSKVTLEQSAEDLKKTLDQVSDEAIEKISKTVHQAEEEAATLRVQSKEEAQRIIAAAQKEAEAQVYSSSKRAATAVEWAMEQWVRETFSVKQHSALIERLVVTYLNDRK